MIGPCARAQGDGAAIVRTIGFLQAKVAIGFLAAVILQLNVGAFRVAALAAPFLPDFIDAAS